jgi:cytochrome c peroxidase
MSCKSIAGIGMMARVVACVVTTGILPAAARPVAVAFTEAELAMIVSLGPWPPTPRETLVANTAQQAKVELGRRLFFDAGLSPSGRVSCSSCHRPEQAWTDGRTTSVGLAAGTLNTPAVVNLALQQRFGWRGRTPTLVAQSQRPLLDAAEMGSSPAHVSTHIRRVPDLARRYAAAFGQAPAGDGRDAADAVFADAAAALAAYQMTLISPRTPFDDFRDAQQRRAATRRSPATFAQPARRGLRLFVGAGGCVQCHSGGLLSDGAVHIVPSSTPPL